MVQAASSDSRTTSCAKDHWEDPVRHSRSTLLFDDPVTTDQVSLAPINGTPTNAAVFTGAPECASVFITHDMDVFGFA